MGGAVSVDETVHVVVVGGGFGGIAAGNQLKSYKIPFTLIDVKDAFHHNPGALRASVESGFAKKTFISFKETFGENFKQGCVINIDLENQEVILESREAVQFSHLILGTGSSGPFPGKFSDPVPMEEAIQMYEDFVAKIRTAPRIAVVGGGSAGVEMAAELKTDYPDKEVTLIHSKIPLADVQLLPSVRQGLKDILLKKGVQLQLGDQLAEDSALHVNKHLQVSGMENVYAIGDCADVKEPKMAYHAGLHAAVAVDNIVRSLTKKPLKTYQPGPLTMLLSMGRNDGIGQIVGFQVGKLVVVPAKSKDMLVWKSWKEMGQTAPP
ncbi:ferroptosis suppressor protein 1-like isoform X2 [Hemitrygon akajei]|uniref:ferroptosis suppressor protein 1-like isoform X2 n=1 Tax=Hemitrygon akajei TaxID=2704970 RepID=UPI003BF9B93A